MPSSEDDDVPKMKQVLEWAIAEGREKDISDELREAVKSGQLSDADIEAKIAEMKAARTGRDFKASDASARGTHRTPGFW